MTHLFLEILPDNQRKSFDALSKENWISDFYLAVGTALALQINHRQSIDFDFFTSVDFNNNVIKENLNRMGVFNLQYEQNNTLIGDIDDVKISFFKYNYKIIEELIIHGNIKIVGIPEIASMKLEAISGRGSKKDFIDLYFILEKYDLSFIFNKHAEKYGANISNKYHLLRSLVYFYDAEEEIMPKMFQKATICFISLF